MELKSGQKQIDGVRADEIDVDDAKIEIIELK